MAIVRSHSMGEAKRSAGLITYRNSKGRVIASQKRRQFTDAERAAYRKTARAIAFKVASLFAASYTAKINQQFSPTKYGSPSNAFVKLNYNVFVNAILWGVEDNLQLVTNIYKTWADVQTVADFGSLDVISVVNNFTLDKNSGMYASYLNGQAPTTVPMGATFENIVPSTDPYVTSLDVTATETETGKLATALTIKGGNLNSDMYVTIGGVKQSGTWNADCTVFTLATSYAWSDVKVFAVYDADSKLLISKQVNGAVAGVPTVTSMDVTDVSFKITHVSITGSNLSSDLKITVKGVEQSGSWNSDNTLFTLATPYDYSSDNSVVVAVVYGSKTLRSETVQGSIIG